MKKLLVLLVTVASLNCFAQEVDDDLAPKVGVKGGINLSNLYVDEVADEHLKVGYNLGLFAKLPLSQFFAIQPELLYTTKGAKLTYNNFLQGSGEYRFNLNYLELPVLAVFNIGKNFNIHAGPYIGFLTSSNIKDVDDDGSVNGVKDLNVDDFNRFDYGLAGGIAVDLSGFTIGARYNYGLREVGKSGNLAGELTNNSKNSVASVYIGFGF
jgi:hypothetical protein